jgi:hypothetical protein
MQAYMILQDYGSKGLGIPRDSPHAGPHPTYAAALGELYREHKADETSYHICPIELPDHTYFHPSRYETT